MHASLGCTPKGAYGNEKGSEKVLDRVLGKVSEKGGLLWVLQQKKRVLRRVLRRGSEKGVSRRCLERPLVEYAPLGVRPSLLYKFALHNCSSSFRRERFQSR